MAVRITICFLLLFSIKTVFAQNVVLPIQHEVTDLYEANLHRVNANFHTSFKPYASKKVYAILDSINETMRFETDNKFVNFGLNENLFKVEKKGDYNITGNLLLGYSAGYSSDTTYGMFVRGGRLEGSLGSKISFSTDIYLGNAIVPQYITSRNNQTRTFIGNGAKRIYIDNGAKQQSTLNATSQITYQPNKYFQFQLGHGKNFIGDGYRSMLLSDNSTFYPYFKVTTSFWNIQYTNLYTTMIDFQSGKTSQGIYPRKFITSHHLSWNVTPRLNIGIFEAIVYQDSSNLRGFDPYYLNPLIFYRPLEFEIGSDGGNALIGFNAKYKITNDIHAYGQFIFDEFSLARNEDGGGCWCNRLGWQLGVKSFNTIIPNLTVQTEVNSATYYTYSHRTPLQNYANSNLALAHPLGANFIESMTNIRYRKDRWTGKVQFMYAVQGLDTLDSHFGADINRPFADKDPSTYYGNEFLQGVRTTTTFTDIAVGYIINPRSNFHIELGYRYRNVAPEIEIGKLSASTDGFIYLGFKTNFTNWYYNY
jgi:hypothetical protein